MPNKPKKKERQRKKPDSGKLAARPSPRLSTSSDRNVAWRGGWFLGDSYLNFKFHQNRSRGFQAVDGRKLPIPIAVQAVIMKFGYLQK